jgi:protein gp37
MNPLPSGDYCIVELFGHITLVGRYREVEMIGRRPVRRRRMMNEEWARDLRDQCAATGVPFFMKQMTKKQPIPDNLMIRQFPTLT